MQEETRANRYLVPRGDEPYESLLEIKRSEFIGHIKRVSTVEEARAYIESVRKTYHDARHVCSAFIIGADRDIQRSSDDGEPAGAQFACGCWPPGERDSCRRSECAGYRVRCGGCHDFLGRV